MIAKVIGAIGREKVFLWRTAALGCSFAGEGACSPFPSPYSGLTVNEFSQLRGRPMAYKQFVNLMR
ncbi:MAG: hypothetical protein NTY36_12600 [Deltaproteobacteria bacterium]|nr:hypothetical protein [Deltaproteobacteria bacterium]